MRSTGVSRGAKVAMNEYAGQADSGFWALSSMAILHGICVDEARLRHEFGASTFDTLKLILAARSLGLTARAVRQKPGRLDKAPLPAVAQDRGGRYFIVAKFDSGIAREFLNDTDGVSGSPRERVLIQRPNEAPTIIALSELLSVWQGELILFVSKASFAGEMAQSDFTWFVPAIVKYRRLLGEI